MEVVKSLLASMLVLIVLGGAEAQLIQNFYRFTCPNVEWIVRQAVQRKMQQTFVTVPATLRLFFHDCFVEGCDASIMITSPNNDAEKDSPDNLSLAGDGFDTIIKAKQAVEAVCPGIVSCADIMAMAARDVVLLSGGPWFGVELGRRDGRLSKAWRVTGNLPQPNFSLNLLNWIFRKNNLTEIDMIALSGAHTLGFSHCNRFSNRLYSFSRSSTMDPTLNRGYAQRLMQACPRNVDPSVAINMDPSTPNTFDNAYYKNLVNGMGLFTSDEVLFTNPQSQGTVRNFASNENNFREAFKVAMVKLGRTGVKIRNQGDIRRDCSAFN